MLQLELLLNLQCIDREIYRVKKGLKDKTLYNRLSTIKKEFESTKSEMDSEIEKLEDNKNTYAKLNTDLKHFDEKHKEMDGRLYNKGTSVKVIENLQKEIESLKLKIDEIENKLIDVVENGENLAKSIKDNKTKLADLKKEFNELKKVYTSENEKGKAELEKLNHRREELIKEIDGTLLCKYSELLGKINNPVSIVAGGNCTECGMKLNAMLYDSLKKGKTIVFCDYCGRILYLE